MWSLKIRRTTFLNYIEFVDPRILRPDDYEMARRVQLRIKIGTTSKKFGSKLRNLVGKWERETMGIKDGAIVSFIDRLGFSNLPKSPEKKNGVRNIRKVTSDEPANPFYLQRK